MASAFVIPREPLVATTAGQAGHLTLQRDRSKPAPRTDPCALLFRWWGGQHPAVLIRPGEGPDPRDLPRAEVGELNA